LPTPGPLEAGVAAAVDWVALVALELLEDVLLLLPQAASATVRAPSASPIEPPLKNFLKLLRLVPVIRRLLVVCFIDRRPYI
jgi:hypothetical protein